MDAENLAISIAYTRIVSVSHLPCRSISAVLTADGMGSTSTVRSSFPGRIVQHPDGEEHPAGSIAILVRNDSYPMPVCIYEVEADLPIYP